MEFPQLSEQKKQSLDFLSGGGEMGERIRNFDWDNNPLGPPEKWDQSLKTCVRIMLTSSQPIWIGWGKDLIKLYNDPYKEIVGGKHPEALGQPARLVWKEIWFKIQPMLQQVMEKNEGTYVESQLLIMHRHGYAEEVYYTYSYSPVPGEDGGTAGMICYNTSDTERVINERSLKTLQQLEGIAKRQSVNEVYEEAAKAITFNNKDFPFGIIYKINNLEKTASPVAFIGVESDQTIFPSRVDLNEPNGNVSNFCEAYYSKEILVSENAGRRKNIPTGFWQKEATHFIHIPIIIPGNENPIAILSAALNPHRKFDNSYKQFAQLIADRIGIEINNILNYEQEKKKAEALAEIDKAKTVFFSNISHEFRTPLTLMLGTLEEALIEPGIVPKNFDRLSITHRNAMRLLKLVNSLLDFSRIESGRQKANYTLTDIVSFTKDLAANFRSIVEKAGLNFIVKADSIIQPVYVDKQMWEKIVFNLLSNAFKYTLDGSITLHLFTENNQIVLQVIDTGIGIPEKELSKMFDRFYRVPNVTGRSYEGTGIGLSLTKEFVQLHGGAIDVTSVVNKGSVFTVTIPLGKDHLPTGQSFELPEQLEDVISDAYVEEARSLLESSDKLNGSIHASEKYTTSVLIVDDNADMRQYITTLLEKKFSVSTAANGLEAIQKVRSERPALIISDIMMPVMDGIQLLKEVKENKDYENIPVILLTARAGEESRIEGYQIGADDYLVKPFSGKELLARVEGQLKITRKRNAIEKQLHSLFEQAPSAIVIFKGPDAVFELANKRALEIIGKTKEEVIDRKLEEALPELKGQGYINLINQVYTTGEKFVAEEAPVTFERNGKRTDTFVKYVFQPLKDEDGLTIGVMVVGDDVGSQVLARKKIEDNEERFRKMANEAPLFVWETDEKLQTTYLNKEGLRYFDLPESFKISELSWKKYIHPGDLERILSIMNESANKHESYTLEMRLKNGATGEYHWFLDKGAPKYINNIFTGFIGTSLDIHERKEAEEELEIKVIDRTTALNHQNILLRQQNDLVKKILDSSVDLIAVYDTDMRIISINQSSLNAMGMNEKEVIGKKLLDLIPDMKDSKGHVDLIKAINGETIHNKIYYSTVSKRYYENFLVPLRNENDSIYAVLVMAHDNTELITSAEQIKLKNQELQKTIELLRNQEMREEQKNNFIQMASHELKTPITSMQGYVQLLLSAYKNDNEKNLSPLFVRSSLHSIEKQIKRLTRLISELLDLSKIDAGQLKMNFELFSLNELAIDIVQDILHTNPKHSINLFHDFECSIYGDKDRIGQVLTNLLTNAIKYSPASEKIEIWIKRAKDKVAVSVKDYGIGIDSKEHDKIFERFYRIKGEKTETYPGFGIGLFIAKDIIHKHNGELVVESEINKGSLFTFILPISKKAHPGN